jgi:hypothetical protein
MKLSLLVLLKNVKRWVFDKDSNAWADKEAMFVFGEKIDERNEE